MCNNQDARPFIDLKKDAEEFREKFDEDINECMSFLDRKITALICDPDSLGHNTSVKQNALAEFSKAKYDIFISVKSMINKKEREWLNYMSEMKKLFIENVEIFLAGTKLEVKLPSSEFQPSLGLRKSPGIQKSDSTSATRSIYPLLSTLTTNIPVLCSPLRRSEFSNAKSEEINDVESNPQFNRRGRLAVSIPKLSESQIGGYAEFSRRGRLSTSSIKLGSQSANTIDSSDSSDIEAETGNEAMDVETGFDLNVSQSGSRRRSSSNKERNPDLNTSQPGSKQISNSSKEKDLVADVPQVRGRRNKKVPIYSEIMNGISQKHSTEDNEVDIPNHNQELLVTDDKKSFRERQKSQKSAVHSSRTTSDENDIQKVKADPEPLKGRRGRATARNKIADSSVVQTTTTSSDENEVQEAKVDPVPLKGRRGRSTTKNKVADSSVLPSASQISEDLNIANGEESIEDINNKTRRGRAAASKNAKTVTVSKMIRRGQRGAKAIIENTKYDSVSSYGKSNILSNEDYSEPGTSSPKKVSFAADAGNSDSDLEAPISRPIKSTVRRKTLLPNLETLTDADVIPGKAARSRSKRKTISGVSELETVAPTKRLKVGIQRIASSQEEDDDANDNLLECDDSYSEWMSLKRVDGKIPTRPAVYEVKVSRAKKTAYIGCCDSLRQKLTLYKLKQGSGHKHLDKFIERNYDDIQVRYEIITSLGDAEKEVKNRIKSFVAQYKTTPAYN